MLSKSTTSRNIPTAEQFDDTCIEYPPGNLQLQENPMAGLLRRERRFPPRPVATEILGDDEKTSKFRRIQRWTMVKEAAVQVVSDGGGEARRDAMQEFFHS